MIDLIRFVLIVLSIGIFIYLAWQSRAERRGMSRYPDNNTRGQRIGSKYDYGTGGLTGEISSPRQVIQQSSSDQEMMLRADRSVAKGDIVPTTQSYDGDAYDGSDQIAFRLKAVDEGVVFLGTDIYNLLLEYRLEPGNKNLFYRYRMDEERQRKNIVFVVCNALEPGTLAVEDLPTLRTTQLFFFMLYAQTESPVSAFDEMLGVAKEFSVKLNGKLFHSSGQPLSETLINSERERVRADLKARMSLTSQRIHL